MPFDIETYLNSLPDDTEYIGVDVCLRGLTYLPELSRFKNLIALTCFDNKLTSLPPLNENLRILVCCDNKLTSLPPLNENLSELQCNNNQLTSLPPLNKNLKTLICNNNHLTSFPNLNKNLKILDMGNNPVYDVLYDLDNIIKTYEIPIKTNKILKIINKFRSLYYQLKFKKHFIKWLWKSRERYFAEKYHPKYLLENLDENTDLDEFLNNW